MNIVRVRASLILGIAAAVAGGLSVPAGGAEPRPFLEAGSFTLTDSGVVLNGPTNAPCATALAGSMRWHPGIKRLLLCDGANWQVVTLTPLPLASLEVR